MKSTLFNELTTSEASSLVGGTCVFEPNGVSANFSDRDADTNIASSASSATTEITETEDGRVITSCSGFPEQDFED